MSAPARVDRADAAFMRQPAARPPAILLALNIANAAMVHATTLVGVLSDVVTLSDCTDLDDIDSSDWVIPDAPHERT
eukprot:gene25776-43172_t